MSKYLLLILTLLLLSCATGKQKQTIPVTTDNDTLVYGAIDKAPVYETPDPYAFPSRPFPESTILLNSVISFTKNIISDHMGTNIKGVNLLNNKPIVLTSNKILVGLPNCASLLVNEDISGIQSADHFILGFNDEDMILFDTQQCGSILKGKMKLPNVRLIPPYLVFFDKNKFNISLIGQYESYLSGEMDERIMDIHGTSDFLSIVTQTGQLVVLDLKHKEFIDTQEIDTNLIKWKLYRHTLFGITDNQTLTSYTTAWDGNKFVLNKNIERSITDQQNCALAENGVGITCDTTFISPHHNLQLNNPYQQFVFTPDTYYGIINNELYRIMIDEQRYIKKVDINGLKASACLDNGTIHLNDLDNTQKVIDIETGNHTPTQQPAACNTPMTLIEGNLIIDNVSFPFSTPVRSENGTTLFQRIIDKNVYYYFEQKQQ